MCGSLLALLIAVTPIGSAAPSKAVRCGGLNISESVIEGLSDFGTYSEVTDLLTTGDPIGLYSATLEGQFVPLLDLNRPGSVNGIKDLQLTTPADYVADPDVDIDVDVDAVQRIRTFLGTRDLGNDTNTANAVAAQLAMWETLGQLDFDSSFDSSRTDRDVWEPVVEDFKQSMKDSPAEVPFLPTRLDARMYAWQWPNWISVQASLTGEGNTPQTTLLTGSTVVTTNEANVDSDGTAVIHVPDPGLGWDQDVAVEWRGEIPTGTLLKAVYDDEAEKTATQAYFVTASSTVASADVVLHRTRGSCRG